MATLHSYVLAQALPFGMQITLILFNMNHFNICPSCLHRNSCVLTAQKDKVWSCSEFDEAITDETTLKKVQQPERILELV